MHLSHFDPLFFLNWVQLGPLALKAPCQLGPCFKFWKQKFCSLHFANIVFVALEPWKVALLLGSYQKSQCALRDM